MQRMALKVQLVYIGKQQRVEGARDGKSGRRRGVDVDPAVADVELGEWEGEEERQRVGGSGKGDCEVEASKRGHGSEESEVNPEATGHEGVVPQ
jgi:hypothetical protein